jgi:molybdopterin synthase catalytic subunit
MIRVAIVKRPLDPAALMDEVASTTCGASIVFVGTVREMNEDRRVDGLDYSAYVPMAERELAAIVAAAAGRWPEARIACEHRIGSLDLGDASVVIAASHPHRSEAFDACRFVIEELKARLPIWKRERYADGGLAWVENASDRGAREVAP